MKTNIKTIIALMTLIALSTSLFIGCQNQTSENTSTNTTTATEATTTTESTSVAPTEKKGPMGSDSSSVDTSNITNKWLDVPYANASSSEKLDIYLPNEGDGPFPVIIAIHGGAFMMGTKTGGDVSAMFAGLDRGYAVVSVEYRLSGEAIFPAQINDIKAAIRFLRANASTYNLDPDKFATWGGSAGGSLSALAGTSGDVTELQDDSLGNADQSDRVQAAVDWFGPIYFSLMDQQFADLGLSPKMGSTSSESSPESAYIGAVVGSAEAETLVKAASPQTYITADDPAFMIQHGTADMNIPITQSVNFSQMLSDTLSSDNVIFEQLEGAGHGTSEFSTAENVAKVLDFLDSQLK